MHCSAVAQTLHRSPDSPQAARWSPASQVPSGEQQPAHVAGPQFSGGAKQPINANPRITTALTTRIAPLQSQRR